MSKEQKEFEIFMRNLKGDIREVTDVDNFFDEALQFSTYLLAVRDRAELDETTYASEGISVARRLAQELPLPSQDLFKSTVEVAQAFMEGYVNPTHLMTLLKQAKAVWDSLAEKTAVDFYSGKGPHKIGEDATAIPKIVTDSLYPFYLAIMMRQYINEQGLVASLSPTNRGMLKALVANDVSASIRMGSPNFDPH